MEQDPVVIERDVLTQFYKHEALRRLRPLYDAALGYPVWWILPRQNGGSSKTAKEAIHQTQEIWQDVRLKDLKIASIPAKVLEKRSRDSHAFLIDAPEGVTHFCIPLLQAGKTIGFFLITGISRDIRPELLDQLAFSLRMILDSASKSEEIGRLSATLRPRAVALSTVHTVHRIINSTLNLDELVRRLAHLTAQVLRVNRCTLYLTEKKLRASSKKPQDLLVCKAKVGFPKNDKIGGRIRFGIGLEGRVAKTAEIVIRKKFICLPLIDEDVVGVVLVEQKKDKKPFNYLDLEILNTLAEESAIAIKNARLYEEQRRVTLGTIQSLAVILGSKAGTTNQFPQESFLSLALGVAHELRLREDEIQALHYAALLKDTAKVGIPEEILHKSGKLTGDEFQLIREHPIKGAKIVQSFENLKSVTPIILYSREKFDGTGYPEGLRGDDIPIGARILSVVNAFEAIVMGRPYRNQASFDEALEEIRRNAGTQFDPRVTDIFLKLAVKTGMRKVLRISTK